MFERDKEELRAAGVPIVTGSNHPDSDEFDGYRILRTDFELPPVSFTPEELAVLGAANSVWQESVAAQRTNEALETLRAAGANPDPHRLDVLRPRIPAEPGFDELLEAIHQRREVGFAYRGQPRRVQPWRLQQRGGRWFLLGFDLDRTAPRHFKLSRISDGVRATGRPDAFAAPSPEVVEQHLEFNDSSEAVTGIVGIRKGAGGDLRRNATTADWDGPVPEGFDVLSVTRPHHGALVDEICSLGPDAIALAPASVRDDVVEQLQWVAKRWGR
nr:WYL domain-containing protein [Tessaracoccus sp. OS52]